MNEGVNKCIRVSGDISVSEFGVFVDHEDIGKIIREECGMDECISRYGVLEITVSLLPHRRVSYDCEGVDPE